MVAASKMSVLYSNPVRSPWGPSPMPRRRSNFAQVRSNTIVWTGSRPARTSPAFLAEEWVVLVVQPHHYLEDG